MTKKAYEAGLSYLSKGIKSKKQVENNLKKKGYDKEEIEKALLQFEMDGYIDDRSFAFSLAENLILKGRGKEKIKYALREKGIAEEIIGNVLEEVTGKESELERGLKLAEKIIEYEGITDENLGKKEREKLIRKLVNRGYNISDAIKIAEEITAMKNP